MNYEIVEVIDPPADAMIRKFRCYVCNKDHLQNGKIVILWVNFDYRTQAAETCINDELEPGYIESLVQHVGEKPIMARKVHNETNS